MNGIQHFIGTEGLVGYAISKSVPYPLIMVYFTGVLLILGGLGVLLGVYPRLAVVLIVVFLIPISFVMHAFWADINSAARMSDQINFFKNIALSGAALIMFAIPEPWEWSL